MTETQQSDPTSQVDAHHSDPTLQFWVFYITGTQQSDPTSQVAAHHSDPTLYIQWSLQCRVTHISKKKRPYNAGGCSLQGQILGFSI